MTVCFAVLTALQHVSSSPLRDPVIPHGETATYRSTEEDREWYFTERTEVLQEGASALYAFEYQSSGETSRVLVERNGMMPRLVESETRGGGLAITSSTAVSFSGMTPAEERIMLLSFSELKYLLRGYRFEQGEAVDVGFLSASDDGADDDEEQFEVSIVYRGTEEMTVNGRSILCHKLQLRTAVNGLLRIVNGLIPKTFYWYSVEAPHYLVAYEGSGGFPGAPKRTIEIVSYSGW